MATERAERIAESIKPFLVEPGSTVDLAKDFDPGYKADFLRKRDSTDVLRQAPSRRLPPSPAGRRKWRRAPPPWSKGWPRGR